MKPKTSDWRQMSDTESPRDRTVPGDPPGVTRAVCRARALPDNGYESGEVARGELLVGGSKLSSTIQWKSEDKDEWVDSRIVSATGNTGDACIRLVSFQRPLSDI